MGKRSKRMTQAVARDELLAQHAGIRLLLAEATTQAAQVLTGLPVKAGFHKTVRRLLVALSEHNAAEERLLEPLLRDADAWGQLRVNRMLEEHAAEHAVILDALAVDSSELERHMAEIAEDLDAHMLAEERTFLSSAVLRDDIVVILGVCS